MTYAELDAAATRTARILAARGVAEGSLVATTLAPGPAFVELLHALPRLGAILVPLNPADPVRIDAALTVDAPLDGPEADVTVRRTVDPEAVHSIIHTSGTSGRPRAVELSYANHHASAMASAEHLGVEEDDRWLGVLPLFHVGGLAVLLRSAIYATTAVLHQRFDPATRARRARRGRDHARLAGADHARPRPHRRARARLSGAAGDPARRRADSRRAAGLGALGRPAGVAHLRNDRDGIPGGDRAARRASRACRCPGSS